MSDSKQDPTKSDHKRISIKDIGKDTERLTTVKVEDLMPLPGDTEFPDEEWKPLPESVTGDCACILDGAEVLEGFFHQKL